MLRARLGLVVASVMAALAAPAGALAGTSTDYAGIRSTLSREIPKEMRATHTVGLSIALVDGGRTVWARGFGSADRAARVPVTADTLFHIGSTSKTLAAAAVMQLVEQGRVDLDTPLSRYVPQFKMLPRFPGSVVTVRSVLDMHSGIPGDIGNGMLTSGRPNPGFRAADLGEVISGAAGQHHLGIQQQRLHAAAESGGKRQRSGLRELHASAPVRADGDGEDDVRRHLAARQRACARIPGGGRI